MINKTEIKKWDNTVLSNIADMVNVLMYPFLGMAFVAYGGSGMLPLVAIGLIAALYVQHNKNK